VRTLESGHRVTVRTVLRPFDRGVSFLQLNLGKLSPSPLAAVVRFFQSDDQEIRTALCASYELNQAASQTAGRVFSPSLQYASSLVRATRVSTWMFMKSSIHHVWDHGSQYRTLAACAQRTPLGVVGCINAARSHACDFVRARPRMRPQP
jgi:hypothetical protein